MASKSRSTRRKTKRTLDSVPREEVLGGVSFRRPIIVGNGTARLGDERRVFISRGSEEVDFDLLTAKRIAEAILEECHREGV